MRAPGHDDHMEIPNPQPPETPEIPEPGGPETPQE